MICNNWLFVIEFISKFIPNLLWLTVQEKPFDTCSLCCLDLNSSVMVDTVANDCVNSEIVCTLAALGYAEDDAYYKGVGCLGKDFWL